MQFTTLSVNSLNQAPSIQVLSFAGRDYKVEFLAFSNPANQGKTPVVFLGGAFQNFASFKSEVERVYNTHPVILVDFPSQGSNDQLAPELALEDYAELIELFCQAQQLERMMMLGISYGSAMATLFATAYPARIERLLLSGITCFRRQSLITLLEDSLALLAAGQMNEFAATAVCNLINHNRLSETEVSSTYRRLLFRQISRLNENERARYAQNTQRLLNFQGFKAYPSCPTVIATGEFDNFTLPSENAAVAAQCANATFALIHNADHLSQHERREAAGTLYHHFMCALPLDTIDGISVKNPLHFIELDKRLQGRQRPLEQPYLLVDEETGIQHTVRIHNLNFAGCELEQLKLDLTVHEGSKQLYLELPETGHRYHIRLLERQRKTLRVLIIQRDLKAADALLDYLNTYPLMARQTPTNDQQLEEAL